jgi:hypothetical protein
MIDLLEFYIIDRFDDNLSCIGALPEVRIDFFSMVMIEL